MRHVAWAVAGFGALVATASAVVPAFRSLPLLAPDSTTYLTWDPLRPLVYPLFLKAAASLSADLHVVGPLQWLAFTAAAVWLATSCARSGTPAWVAIGLGCFVQAHPQVVGYAFTILPESLLMSLVMLHLGAIMRFVEQPRDPRWPWLAGIALGLAILTKPVAMSFVAGVPIVAVCAWRAGVASRVLVAFSAAVLLPVAAASAVNLARIGVFAPQAIGGFATLGVAGTFLSDEVAVTPPALKAALLQQLTPIRDELQRLDSLTLYYVYSSSAFHDALERARDVILVQAGVAPGPAVVNSPAYLELNAVAGRVTRAAIAAAPAAYARHVSAHLYGLWMMPLVRRAGETPPFDVQLARARESAPFVARSPVAYRVVPDAVYWPFQALLVFTLISATTGVGRALLGRVTPQWLMVGYAGALLHGYYLLTAAAQTGLPRYAIAAWPLMSVVAWASIAAATRRLSRPGA